MLALIDALYWQIVLWMVLCIAVVNVFIRIQAYLADPGHDEFVTEWFEAFEAHQAARYKAGGMNWRVRDLSDLWGGMASFRQEGD